MTRLGSYSNWTEEAMLCSVVFNEEVFKKLYRNRDLS